MTRGTLALVESPAQFLHVLEWCHAAGVGDDTRIAVLAPRDETSREQLRTMLDFSAEEDVPADFHDLRQGPAALVRGFGGLRGAVAEARRLVIGDPFSGLVQALLPSARAGDVVVVDDGTATIEFADQLAEGRPLSRWDRRRTGPRYWLRTPLGRAALRFFTPTPDRSVAVFTAMPVRQAPGLAVHPNHYEWTRRRFGRPEVVPGTDVVGSSLVESGVVDAAAYLRAVTSLAAGAGPGGRYYAHRREEDAKLRAIAASTGLRIVRPRVPLEIELRRGPVAERVVAFPSSVGYTLPVVLASVAARVIVVPVEPEWLRAGVGEGPRSFLAGLARSGRPQQRWGEPVSPVG